MTCAVAHYDPKEGCTVLDCVREVRPPFSPESVTEEFCNAFAAYKIAEARADNGAVASSWKRSSATACTLSRRSKPNSLHAALLPIISSARCRLLDVPRLANQLTNLERRVGRGTGPRLLIHHPPAAHDDPSNAAAGAVVMASQRTPLKIDPSVLQRARAMARPGERASLQPPVATAPPFTAAVNRFLAVGAEPKEEN